MTATYTPEVAAARERLERISDAPQGVKNYRAVVLDADLRLLLSDHARLAEENAVLKDRVTNRDAALVVQSGQHTLALAALRAENVKLRRVVEAAKAYGPYLPDVEPIGAAKYSDMNCKAHALLAALAALEVENG